MLFLEFLGVSSAFQSVLPQLRLTQSSYSYFYNESALRNESFLNQLFDKEAENVQRLYSRERSQQPTQPAAAAAVTAQGEGVDLSGGDACGVPSLDPGPGPVDPGTAAMMDLWRDEVPSASTAAACCQACVSTPLCIGWALADHAHSRGGGARCHLKGSLRKAATAQELSALEEDPRTDISSGSLLLSGSNPKGKGVKPR
jgi:hypothetical protein